MELFKNGVGRPSNEIKKKRRNFVIAVILVCIIVIGGLGYLIIGKSISSKKIKGAISYGSGPEVYKNYYYYKTDSGLILMKTNTDNAEIAFFPKGDVDFNGVVSETDARLALRVSARLDTFDTLQMWNADLNNDGKITTSEARQILVQSSNPNGFKQFKTCLTLDPSAKDCNWNTLRSNGYNKFKISNGDDYYAFVYDTSTKKTQGYWPVTFNGKVMKGNRWLNINIPGKKVTSSSLKVGKSAIIEVETNSNEITKIWSTDSSKVSIKMTKKLSGNRRRYEVKAKKSGSVNVYAQSNDGATGTFAFTIGEDWIRMGKFNKNWIAGYSGEFDVETNGKSITDVKYNGKVVRIKLVKKYSNNKRRYSITAIGEGKTEVKFYSSNGKTDSVTYEVKANYPDPSKVINHSYGTNTSTGVKIYSDQSCNYNYVKNYLNVISKLPSYAKKAVGRVYIINDSRYDSYESKDASGVTHYDGGNIYVTLRCSSGVMNSTKEAEQVAIHEFGHAVGFKYNTYTGESLEKTVFNYKGVYERAKNNFSKEILTARSNYAMTNVDEFFAQAYVSYIWKNNFKYKVGTVNSLGYKTVGSKIDVDGYTKYALKKVNW